MSSDYSARVLRLQGVIFIALAVLVLSLFGNSTLAQTGNNSTTNSNQAAESPAPSPTPISFSTLVTEAEEATSRLRTIRTSLVETSVVRAIQDEIPQVIRQIDGKEPKTRETLAATPTLDEISSQESEWQSIGNKFSSWRRDLREQIAVLDKNIDEMDQMARVWRLSLSALGDLPADPGQPDPASAAVPPAILQRAEETIDAIDETRRMAQERRTQLLSLQTRVSESDSRVVAIRDEIRAARNRTLTNLLYRDESPIWAPQNQSVSPGFLLRQAVASFSEQFIDLRIYAAERAERFGLHGLVFILITAALYWARSRVHPFVEKEPKLEKAAQIFAVPVATGLILTIIFSTWFYPQAPRMLTSLIGAAALVPVVVLLRRMVDRPLFIILNALVALYFVDTLREILANQPFTARIVLLMEMLGAILFLIWFLKSKSLLKNVEAAHYRIFKTIRKMIPIALVIFVVAFITNVLGFVSLANVIGNGVLSSAYIALVIYTAVQIVRGLIIFALRVRPLVGTLIVQNNRPLIRERSVKIVSWFAVIIWLLITLNLFSIRQTIFSFIRNLLSWSFTVGSLEISLGSVVLFFVMIWVAVLISRFVRFVLEEDVYPRINLGGGVSYAVSTVLHYSVLVVGFLIAIGALGIDFSQFALIAGAVGIGIGFGLQNIINNFVSGMILLFERPVKVGDTIQIEDHMGDLNHIGLRASVLRTVDGSDVIVPNSMLISEAVINWTMSDKQRRIDIPVGVAYGSDPEFVLQVLASVGASMDGVLTDPPPRGMFVGFGDFSLNFEMRAWTDRTDGWVSLRSKLVTALYAALNEANIEIPFPENNLNVQFVNRKSAQGSTPEES